MNNNFKGADFKEVSAGANLKQGWRKMISVKMAVIAVIVIFLLALFYYYKGLFVAVTVNGSPISRLAVVRELESKSGKAALESLITIKLIDAEAQKKGITISGDEIANTIKNIEDQVKSQGQTLAQALEMRGLTEAELKKQIMVQKELEKLIADKINVTDEEVQKYITANKVAIPKGQKDAMQNQIKDQLRQQKFSAEAQTFIAGLHKDARIRYFVNY